MDIEAKLTSKFVNFPFAFLCRGSSSLWHDTGGVYRQSRDGYNGGGCVREQPWLFDEFGFVIC